MNKDRNDSTILGRLVHSDAWGFSFCPQNPELPDIHLGCLVRAEVNPEIQTLAVVTNLGWAGDGLSEQLAVTEPIDNALLEEDRQRNGGPIILARFVGYIQNGRICQCLPPRPPSALTCIHQGEDAQWTTFTVNHAYLRLLYAGRTEFPFVDVLAHLASAAETLQAAAGRLDWMRGLISALVKVTEGDHALLRNLIYAISNRSFDTPYIGE